MICSMSSSSGKTKWKERETGGRGMSQMPTRVTMPKLDCANSPSSAGPDENRETCQLIGSSVSRPPSPVRMTSPLPRTISIPQSMPKWSK